MKIKTVAFAVAAVLTSLGAQAAEDVVGKGYGFLSVGYSKADLGDAEAFFQSEADLARTFPGVTATVDVEDTALAYAIGAGYRINANLAVEGYYRHFGKFEAGMTATNGMAYVNEKSEFEASGLGVGLIGLVPVNEMVSLYARADIVNVTAEEIDSVSGTFIGYDSISRDDTITKLGFGLGAQFSLQRGLSLRLDYQQIEAEIETDSGSNAADIGSVNLALLASF
jgi:opacity protein-like surface antigen